MLMYVTAFGKNPFEGAGSDEPSNDKHKDATFLRNARGLISFANMAGRSDGLQSMLSGLTAKEPRQRFSSAKAFNHSWFSDNDVSKVSWDAFEMAASKQTVVRRSCFF
jgi:serine/threonine protein kinase